MKILCWCILSFLLGCICVFGINKIFCNTDNLSDYDKIQKLILWERQARVRHLTDELENCYFPDATVTTSWTKGSISEYLKGGNRAESSSAEIIINRSATPIIHQKGNRAYVEYPSTTIRRIYVNDEEAVLHSYMRLIYKVEKRNNVWKISDLTTIDEYDTLEPAVPGTDLHIDKKDLQDLRTSYRFLAYTRIKAGGKVSQDLLGIDRPSDIEKVYSDTEKWLNNK